MVQTQRADALTNEAVQSAAPIDPRSFLTSCALCSVAGLTVLAGLAQALVVFLGPAT